MGSATQAAQVPVHVDYVWKIVIGGAGGVGKSTLIHRYIFKEFKDNTVMTIGCSHHSQYITKGDQNINLIIWDLGGQKRFEMLHPAYIGGAAAAYLMFDMARIETLEEIERWIQLIRKNNHSGIPVILVGTKYDLVESQEQMDNVCALANRKVADHQLVAFIVTSSKLNYNVDETSGQVVEGSKTEPVKFEEYWTFTR
nr:GTP-binding protein [Candidatus Sigynarchaeota archaeon]